MARASAFARAALAGNPSDGYGGATLAVVVRDFRAEVEARLATDRSIAPEAMLVRATVSRFHREIAPHAPPAAVRLWTSIPRAVGLGGSSAIVIATARALCELHEVTLHQDELATFALAVETEDLGIAAGLQDRVAQAYGGLTFMDFRAGRYESLDPALLPPLFLAWKPEAARNSGLTHGNLRARFERGEQIVRAAMYELAGLARTARSALLSGDHDAFARCVDGSFEARRRMMTLDDRHVRMIELAREHGASANYTGSGGAIVGSCRDDAHCTQVVAAFEAAGHRAIAPGVTP
ncbi:MAG: glucuronokinase [Solirubrobacteraceae bacterium]|jgi:glucuronokinase|nr:glucuronokinase [Solirubrobacteraceae bacterium]